MGKRLSFTVIVCLFSATLTTFGAGSQPEETHASDLPFNITVDRLLRNMVLDMLERSPTFAAQIRTLGGKRFVRVAIVLRNQTLRDEPRARCQLSRYQYGRVEAVVEVSSAVNIVELIAHELEHVMEFAEGLNYRALALTQPDSVRSTSEGHFETSRAIAAGERVAHEMRLAEETFGRRHCTSR